MFLNETNKFIYLFLCKGAAYGKGRGRQVIAAAKTSDLILLVLDATKGEIFHFFFFPPSCLLLKQNQNKFQ
jgi:hypothetical protein